MRKTLLLLLLLVSSFCFSQYRTISLKSDINLSHIGVDIGELHNNNFYDGILGTLPITNHDYSINVCMGQGFKDKHIVYGILGLFENSTTGVTHLNLGIGYTRLLDNFVLGVSYTNNEKICFKVGLYLN